jgi:phytoene dehydrogenase-like protein
MSTENYDVIVIGGGPGGLSCAALCAKQGLRTLLIEKNGGTGGKAVTPWRNGFKYELGPKLQVPVRDTGFAQLFEALGIPEKLRPIQLSSAEVWYKGPSDQWKTMTNPDTGTDPSALFELWGLDDSERLRALEIMTGMITLKPEQLDELDDVSMQTYLDRIGDIPHGLYNYMAMHANASLAEPIDQVAASEQIKILQHIALQGAGGYYEGGFGRVLDDIADAIREGGGEILTGTRVEQILVEDGRATGVRTSAGDFRAGTVVSDAGLQPTVLKLVGKEHFEKSYVDYVESLVPGWGWASIRYFLSERVMKANMYMAYADGSWLDVERAGRICAGEVPDEVILFITVPSNFDSSMAPPGKQCLVTGTICPPDPDGKVSEILYRKIDEIMQEIFPEAWAVVERKECEGPVEVSQHTRDSVLPGGQGGECVGLAQIAGQCGRLKPDPQSPITGLYFAGCDAGSEGMGTHQASTSGMRVAGLVIDAHAAGRKAS